MGQVACCREIMSQLHHPDFVDKGTRKRRAEWEEQLGLAAWRGAQLSCSSSVLSTEKDEAAYTERRTTRLPNSLVLFGNRGGQSFPAT